MEKMSIAFLLLSIVFGVFALVHFFKNINSQTRRNLLLSGWLFILTSITALIGNYVSTNHLSLFQIVMLSMPILGGVVNLYQGYRTSRDT